LRPGDTLVVWKLDRLARSLIHLLAVMRDFQEQGIALLVLEGLGAQLTVATADGKLFLSLLGAFAEFEREMIRERVIAGLAAARARGHHGGRRPKLTPEDEAFVRDMAQAGIRIPKLAPRLKCSRHTIYRALAQHAPVDAQAAD